MRRRLEVAADADRSGIAYAFLLGGVVGGLVAYPALPASLRAVELGLPQVQAGPVTGPLIGGVALLLLFVLGVYVLNWLFLESAGK